MNITVSDHGTRLEVSKATGKALVNLNRDNLTRTMDGIDYGVEINDAFRNRPAGVDLEVWSKQEFGICYAQLLKYRRMAYAAYNPATEAIVVRHAHLGFEACHEAIRGRINLRYCS